MDKAVDNERRTVIYSGRVQGVGFRATARQHARNFAVTGYVRNRADGTVELVAEGHANELDRFLESVAKGMGSFIRNAQISTSTAAGEFDSFEIQV